MVVTAVLESVVDDLDGIADGRGSQIRSANGMSVTIEK